VKRRRHGMADDYPIAPLDGGKIIELAGIRIARGLNNAKLKEKCSHKRMVYDTAERRVWCEDCSRTIDAFDALLVMIEHLDEMCSEARRKLSEAREVHGKTARLRATKMLDKVWSGNVMAVACPHCRKGLLPEDFAGGASSAWARDLEIGYRRKANEAARSAVEQPTSCEDATTK
jgi:hypothetical protein